MAAFQIEGEIEQIEDSVSRQVSDAEVVRKSGWRTARPRGLRCARRNRRHGSKYTSRGFRTYRTGVGVRAGVAGGADVRLAVGAGVAPGRRNVASGVACAGAVAAGVRAVAGVGAGVPGWAV